MMKHRPSSHGDTWGLTALRFGVAGAAEKFGKLRKLKKLGCGVVAKAEKKKKLKQRILGRSVVPCCI